MNTSYRSLLEVGYGNDSEYVEGTPENECLLRYTHERPKVEYSYCEGANIQVC